MPRLIHLAETESTNRFLLQLAETEDLPSGSIVLADCQTAGRGQRGNSWESAAGENLTFSVFFRPADLPANRPFVVSEMAALSVKYTLDGYLPDVSVKWPNDIYYRDFKITGMLIETVLAHGKIARAIIGIGLNVNQTAFSPDLPNPISMASAAGTAFDRMAVLADFRRIFDGQSERLNRQRFDAIHADYLRAVYRREGYYKYADDRSVFEAKISAVEPDGHLILERRDGARSRYAFKEVTFVP
jgi:BirA family biotin operon repressor/biotin-[acetyl-CoA-carboxylase] ligase